MKNKYNIIFTMVFLLTGLFSCEEFVEIDPPRTDLIKSTVFGDDATAQSAILDIYYGLYRSGFASGSNSSINYLASLSSDEQRNYFGPTPQIADDYNQFENNELLPKNSQVLTLWQGMYKCIYKANAVIEGLESSRGVSGTMKDQLTGEAKFLRAFSNFYLVNLFGDVPLVTTTDYKINASVPRAPALEVYQQIINDLTDAQSLLADDYSVSAGLRVRVNKGAATALLARTYLFIGDFTNAEAHATAVIENTDLYALEPDLLLVFRTTSPEAIFQFWSNSFPVERFTFNIGSSGPANGALRHEFINTIETGDQRWAIWGRSREVNGETYYYTLKYLSFITPPQDFSTVMRLAEQYLIRAEARAQLEDIEGAQNDIDIIRQRAGLLETTADTKELLLLAVEQERKAEFFTEWGHRWFDLKRFHRTDEVLTPLKPQWSEEDELYPIPDYEIHNNSALRDAQNPGY